MGKIKYPLFYSQNKDFKLLAVMMVLTL